MKKYTKEEFIMAAKKGEVSIIDAKHIISRLDDSIHTTKEDKDIEIKDLINWQAVSRTLAANDNSIRGNKCPKKYQKRVDRLIYIVSLWVKWNNNSK